MAALNSDSEMEYLSPSFNPKSLTVPRLRSILLSHDIAYPPSAKKPQLVDIFDQELVPRSKKILAARSRIRRTSKGITDMPSSQEGTVNGEEEDPISMPPPPIPDTPKQKHPKSARSPTGGSLPEQAASRISRRSSHKHPRPSDTETEPETETKRPSARKTRKSLAPNDAKLVEGRPRRPSLDKSPFSSENPFQSGSSPPAPGESRRRKAENSDDRRKSTSRRRKTDGMTRDARANVQQQDGVVVPSSMTFETPVIRSNGHVLINEPEEQIPAGEDFTPEEQLELAKERAQNGRLDLSISQKRKRTLKSSTIPKSTIWMILFTTLLGYALWYRREKIQIGYCGIGRASDAIVNIRIPEWARVIQPECEPCPQHAFCYEDLVTRCDHDYILTPHPLSIGGLIPLPPTCEPDGEKARRVRKIADRAVAELRERNAKSECGTLVDEQGKAVKSPLIDETDLKHKIAEKKRRSMGEAEFDDLWRSALGEVISRDEITSSTDGLTQRTLLASTFLARLPLSCSLRRSIRLTLARYRIQLATLTLVIYAALHVRRRFIISQDDSARIPTLVSMTLDRLAAQAWLHSCGDAPESWISVGQLRDDVLRDEFSAQRREGLWKRVREVVEMNSNVRASERELRAGDMSRVWEWIGKLGFVDDGRAERGRRSGIGFGHGNGRTSMTPDGKANADSLGYGNSRRGTMEKKDWDEGRPIY
ncbi:MAG: hypothetical protein LQ342_001516 [Letrouitia transgressa]|nr:MAG: hypothetical protein LQ342_001516 [Letrouitia transgressa]